MSKCWCPRGSEQDSIGVYLSCWIRGMNFNSPSIQAKAAIIVFVLDLPLKSFICDSIPTRSLHHLVLFCIKVLSSSLPCSCPRDREVRCNDFTYNAAISAAGRAAQWQISLALLEEMTSAAVQVHHGSWGGHVGRLRDDGSKTKNTYKQFIIHNNL